MKRIDGRAAAIIGPATAALLLVMMLIAVVGRHHERAGDGSSPAVIDARTPGAEASVPFDYPHAVRVIEQQSHVVFSGDPSNNPGPLRVIIAQCGRDTAHCFQAMFFYNNQFVGVDSGQDAFVRVHATDGTTVELSYPQYANSDALCCPSGRNRLIRWRYENGRLIANVPLKPDPNDRDLNRLDAPFSLAPT